MATPDPHKSVLPNPDPENKPWHRLFIFWEAYAKEFTNLLKPWHNSAAQPQRNPHNEFYNSFLDTWGKGNFVDASVELKDKSYFAALATASFGPLNQCLATLKKMLKTDSNGNFIEPPTLTINEDEANKMANTVLTALAMQYHEEADVLKKVDGAVKSVIGGSRDPKNPYLQALIRMMDIETNCFRRQAYFLDHGKLDPSNPAP